MLFCNQHPFLRFLGFVVEDEKPNSTLELLLPCTGSLSLLLHLSRLMARSFPFTQELAYLSTIGFLISGLTLFCAEPELLLSKHVV
jgi:hypothetical protein